MDWASFLLLQVNRIIKNSLEPKVLQDQDHDTSQLLNEVHMDYARTMNKIVFDANAKSNTGLTGMGSLLLPPAPAQKAVPDFGCLQLPEATFSQCFSSFAFNSFLTKAPGTWGRPLDNPKKNGPKGKFGADADIAKEVIQKGEDKKLKTTGLPK